MHSTIPLIMATHNAHKVAEIQPLLPGWIQLQSLGDVGYTQPIPEPHPTLEENAREKATVIWQQLGSNCFSEDTGLEVDALGGAPGVHSARFAGEAATAPLNNSLLLTKLAGEAHRQAQFRTVMALYWEGTLHFFTGICRGHILEAPIGTEGFGYDPLFVPEGATLSFAQMDKAQKAQYSHRAKALQQLVDFLQMQ